MSVFGDYSLYYDLLYKDKDYEAESDYISGLIKRFKPYAESILELGCGTGKHAKLLNEKGFCVHGIDLSKTMLEQALGFENRTLSFSFGDVRDYRIERKFDAVISLFHVASYQNTNEDLLQYFKTANVHLNSGDIFIFDFWYGPAVLSEKPENRVKYLEDNRVKIERKAFPVVHYNRNVVDVNYEILIKNKDSKTEQKIEETHKMRYLFIPELELMLADSGFEIAHIEEWLSAKKIGPDTWGVCLVGVKK